MNKIFNYFTANVSDSSNDKMEIDLINLKSYESYTTIEKRESDSIFNLENLSSLENKKSHKTIDQNIFY